MKVREMTHPMDESLYTEFSSRVALIWNYFNNKKRNKRPTNAPTTQITEIPPLGPGPYVLKTTLWGDLPGLILYRYTLRPLFTPCLDPSP